MTSRTVWGAHTYVAAGQYTVTVTVAASGVAIDPAGGDGLWVVDCVDHRVYAYARATMEEPDEQSAASIFDLITLNESPEGIADPLALRDTDRTLERLSGELVDSALAAGRV